MGAFGRPKGRKGTQKEHFGGIFDAFFKSGGNSDFRYSAHAIFNFSGFQGTPKSRFFDVFSEAAPRTSPEGTLGRTVEDFCGFFLDFGIPSGLPFGSFLTKVGIFCGSEFG